MQEESKEQVHIAQPMADLNTQGRMNDFLEPELSVNENDDQVNIVSDDPEQPISNVEE